jgi:hypothetical protein
VTRVPLFLAIAALLALAETAQAQRPAPAPAPSLGIQAPPRGRLSREQLEAVARDIRALETHPLASDAVEAGRELLVWLIDSPDVTVKACSGVLEPLTNSTSRYHREMLLQVVLSSGAYVIEHPDQAGDVARVAAGGLEGALNMYVALKAQQGKEAADAFMERLLEIRQRGGLEERERELTRECR